MFRLAVIAVVSVATGLGPRPPRPPVPLEQGTVWVYEGQVSWTVPNSAEVRSAPLRWVAEVVESFDTLECRAALVRGWPDELAWYEPGQNPGLTLVVMYGNRVFTRGVQGEPEAREAVAKLSREAERVLLADSDVFLDLPLAKSKRWGGDPGRADTLYCWFVEDVREGPLRVRGCPSSAIYTTYTVAYRTLPDHQVVEIAPGLGIVRYEYEHHGTVACADVRLVEFRAPKAKKRAPNPVRQPTMAEDGQSSLSFARAD